MSTNNAINTAIPIQISKGGTNTSSLNDINGVIYYDGSGISTVYPGTTGQVLTSNGVGSPPSFESKSGSTWTLIQTMYGNNTSSDIIFTNALTNTYSLYSITFTNILALNTYSPLDMYLSYNGGTTYITSYTSLMCRWAVNVQTSVLFPVFNKIGLSTSVMPYIPGGNSTDRGYSGALWLYNMRKGGSGIYPQVTGSTRGNARTYKLVAAPLIDDVLIDTIKISLPLAPIYSGSVSLYGINI